MDRDFDRAVGARSMRVLERVLMKRQNNAHEPSYPGNRGAEPGGGWRSVLDAVARGRHVGI